MSSLLSDYFTGMGAKRLSSVEAEKLASNQHEFNGVSVFRRLLGKEKTRFNGLFLYLSEDHEYCLEDRGILTWYDAREKNPSRTEYRLYYSPNSVMSAAATGDLAIIGLSKKGDLVIIIAQEGSTSEQQLLWLFGLTEVGTTFQFKIVNDHDIQLDFAGKRILQSLGIEIPETFPDYLEKIISRYGSSFPPTKEFSSFSRSTLKHISAVEDPDNALILWIEREEMLFRTLEKHLVSEKLKTGFGKDDNNVDEFIRFSLSIQNRRKSRAGHAFENHVAYIFDQHNIKYSRGSRTERNNKPDFIFPDIISYHNHSFPSHLLTVLGLKTTAKERWRQILSEADKIDKKHLLTLEPSISKNQTDEMIAKSVQLVVPQSIIQTYTAQQQKMLMNFCDFISFVNEKQKRTDGRCS